MDNTSHKTKKKGPGAPKKPESEKTKSITIRLPQDALAILSSYNRSQAKVITSALKQFAENNPPDTFI